MDVIDRRSVLALLTGDWSDYVPRFQGLSPDEQAAFLSKQGYKRLADLLAHIAAWWEEGLRAIRRYQIDPAARQPEIDVDRFNARAVEKVRAVGDEEEIRVFEEARRNFIDVMNRLSDEDFRDERILKQIRMELVDHLEDHRIP